MKAADDDGMPINMPKNRPIDFDLPSGERITLVRRVRKDGHEVIKVLQQPKGTKIKRAPRIESIAARSVRVLPGRSFKVEPAGNTHK